MKKDRKSRKELLNIYSYLDHDFEKISSEEKRKLDKKFQDRKYSDYLWQYEYYGIFKVGNDRIAIDPKRFNKITNILDSKQLKIMSNRNTSYYHPRYKEYYDYKVNLFVNEITEIKKWYLETYKGIIDKSLKYMKREKHVDMCDNYNFMCGISGPNSAETWARFTNFKIDRENMENEFILYNSLYSQFFHNMVSRIEAITIKVYSSINPKFKKFHRDLMYNNINPEGLCITSYPSFKFYDRMYLIWNFIKHNNIDAYNNLKKDYPEVLVDEEYAAGDLAIHYLKLNEKLILETLDGVSQFFKDWCFINLKEDYERAQWDYDNYFISEKNDYYESISNPLGLSPFDDLD